MAINVPCCVDRLPASLHGCVTCHAHSSAAQNLHLLTLIAIATCSPLKGILFWRWDGVTAAVQDSSVGDNALNVATSSDVFQVGLHNPEYHAVFHLRVIAHDWVVQLL